MMKETEGGKMAFSNSENTLRDLIHVAASVSEFIEASHGDISVTIRGTSLVSGNSALAKAREVASLVAELKGTGILEEQIELRSVHAEVSTGSLGNKASSAIYTLSIGNIVLAKIADVVGIVTSQKTATLNRIGWRYAGEESVMLTLLEKALHSAQRKAFLMATTLGVELLGVSSATESSSDEEDRNNPRDYILPASSMRQVRTRVDSDELGLAVTHRKEVRQSVQLSYRIASIPRS